MKLKIEIFTLLSVALICCNNAEVQQEVTKIDADSLIAEIDKYNDTNVEIEGTIIHVCGVDRKKMKLKTEKGAVIKIVPKDSLSCFDKFFNKKLLKISGIVKESRIEKQYIDRMENEKTLLCHIDHTPCKDNDWIEKQIEKGIADSLSNKDITKLRKTMEQTGKDYVSVVTIYAEKCEIIE